MLEKDKKIFGGIIIALIIIILCLICFYKKEESKLANNGVNTPTVTTSTVETPIKKDIFTSENFPNGKVEQFKNGKLIREICTNGTINEFDEEGHFTKTIGFNGYTFEFDHKNDYISLKTPDNHFIEYKNKKPFRITYPDKSVVNVDVDENGNIIQK